MTLQYKINIASPPDRERLVAEVFFEDVQWAEVNQEESRLAIEIYSRPDGQPWRLPFDVAISALVEAKNRLV